MTLRFWKHLAVIGAAGARIVAVIAGLIKESVIGGVGTVIAILLGAARYFLGEAEERRKRQAEQERAHQAGRVERSQSIAVPAPVGERNAHDEIEEAFQYVAQGRPDLALDRLTALKQRRWDHLSDRARYRLLANRGNARLASQDKAGAARDYIRARKYQPSDEDARSFEALGHLLLGERKPAQELAAEICREHPALGRAQMIRIRTASKETPLDELQKSVPSAVLGLAEVALALHDRALAENRPEQAERILRDLPDEEHGWIPVTLALGGTILQQQLARIRMTFSGPVVSDRSDLVEAVDLFTKALAQIPELDPEGFAFGAYMNRGTAQALLREDEAAREDFRRASELKPDDERAVIALAESVRREDSDSTEAITLLERYLRGHDSALAELRLLELLRQRARPGDFDRLEELLDARLPCLTDLEEKEQRVNAVAILVDVKLRTDRGNQTLNLINELPDGVIGPAARHAILGDILRRLGRGDDALAEARRARDALGDSLTWSEVGRTALLLERLGQHEEAFELWRRIVDSDFMSPETHYLLHCARQAGKHDFVLQFCRELRDAGHFDQRSLGHEVEILIQYCEYTRARQVLSQYLDAVPQDKIARLYLAILVVQLGWDEVAATDSSELPTVEELDNAEIGALVTDVLRAGPDPVQAVDYAYDLYRRFPEEMAAHRALIVAVLAPGSAGMEIVTPKEVTPGTAVCYSEISGAQTRWVVIEDSEDPSLSRAEYRDSHPLARAMLGKVVGDEFPLSEGSLREPRGTIVEVRDKRVYRSNELLQGWRERFPDRPFFEAVPVRATDTPTLDDFAEVTKMMKRLTESREQLVKMYADGKLPIASLALFRGLTVFEVVTYLGANVSLAIRASTGRPLDLREAFEVLNRVEVVVLDPTAVATLALLEDVELIDSLPFRCVVTEGTLQELRSLTRDDCDGNVRDYMRYNGGRLWIEELDPELEAKRQERLGDFVSRLEEQCEVVGGSDLTRMNSATREQFMECVASGSLQAAAVSSQRGAVLWSDDHLFHELVKDDLRSPRVWTQAVFLWAQDRGIIGRQHNSRVAARMMRSGYVFIVSSPAVVLDTCEAASWRLEDPDLAAVLADFGNSEWDNEPARRVVEETVSRIWREAPTVAHARSITARLLAHLASRQDHERIVRNLMESADSLLGLALTRTDHLRETLRVFLKYGTPVL